MKTIPSEKHLNDDSRINLELKETTLKFSTKLKEESGYEMTFEEKFLSSHSRQMTSLKASCSSSPGSLIPREDILINKIEYSSSQIVDDNPCEEDSFDSGEDRKRERDYDLTIFETKKSRHICEQCFDALDLREGKSRIKDLIDNEKVDQILNDIYSSHFRHITGKKIDLGHYENLIQSFSEQKDREANLNLVKQLAHKLSKKIKKMKDTIYDNIEVKALIDNFMKNSYDTKKKNCSNCNATIPSPCHHDDLKKIIKLMILELKKIYSVVIEASSDLENIFKGPMSHLTGDDESIYERFEFEDIQREEFCKWVYKDDFIKTIIFQMKRKISNFEDISELITAVEIDLNKGKKEMTRLERCLAKEIKKICQEKEMFKDIDDLVKYINGKEENVKPKKIKKKNNHKKEKKVENISNTNTQTSENRQKINLKDIPIPNAHNISDMKEQIDHEIEEFKNSLSVASIPAFSIRKIRPYISKEWILSLKNSVTSI